MVARQLRQAAQIDLDAAAVRHLHGGRPAAADLAVAVEAHEGRADEAVRGPGAVEAHRPAVGVLFGHLDVEDHRLAHIVVDLERVLLRIADAVRRQVIVDRRLEGQVSADRGAGGGTRLLAHHADIDGFEVGHAVEDWVRGAVVEAVAHQREAAGIDEVAGLAVDDEVAGPGQEGSAALVAHDEEAVALDREILVRIRRGDGAALADRAAQGGLDRAGVVVADIAGIQQQRRELRRGALVAGGAGVLDVLGHRRNAVRLSVHPGDAGAEHADETHADTSLTFEFVRSGHGVACAGLKVVRSTLIPSGTGRVRGRRRGSAAGRAPGAAPRRSAARG